MKNARTQSIIEYNVISLKRIPALKSLTNQPIELSGETNLKDALLFFSSIRGFIPEVIYRSGKNQDAVLIYSTLNDEQYLRPLGIRESPIIWTKKDLDSFDKAQAKDKAVFAELDFFELGKVSGGFNEKKFYQNLYKISPNKEKAVLRGQCLTLPALIAVNWFWPFAKSVFYENEKLT
ncbi:MAG: hypothetical protein HYV53_00045 [Parcubacteria group bacterium]|nr:hypothetical protein [Parcubacteria group bacterium]